METNEIITQIGIWVAAIGGGSVLVAYLTKFGLAIVNYCIRKKPIQLTADDKSDIANLVAEKVSNDMQSGVTVDIDAQIDRATQKRLTTIENKTNDYIKLSNKLTKIVSKLSRVMCSLKSPDSLLKEDLLSELDTDEIEAVEAVKEDTKGVIKVEAKHKKSETESY